MKYIKGVHRHGSETFLIVSNDQKGSEPNTIIKTSTTKNGIDSIVSEYNGINWYNNLSKHKIICNLDIKTKTYYRIEIKLNKGFFNLSPKIFYQKIKKYLDLTIQHYTEIWHEYKNKNYSPFHGDLSLVGNVMFNELDDVLFVDWEQFDNSSRMPTGLDMIMIIIENVWYETLRSNHIPKVVLKHVKKLIEKLIKAQLLSPLLQEKPALSTLNFINANIGIWKGQHYKLPVLKVPKHYIIEIDNAMSN